MVRVTPMVGLLLLRQLDGDVCRRPWIHVPLIAQALRALL